MSTRKEKDPEEAKADSQEAANVETSTSQISLSTPLPGDLYVTS